MTLALTTESTNARSGVTRRAPIGSYVVLLLLPWVSCGRGDVAGVIRGRASRARRVLISVEPERDAGEEPDLGVRRFDEPLREAGVERGVDRGPVCGDPTLQLHERGH